MKKTLSKKKTIRCIICLLILLIVTAGDAQNKLKKSLSISTLLKRDTIVNTIIYKPVTKSSWADRVTMAVSWLGALASASSLIYLSLNLRQQRKLANESNENAWKILRLSTNTNITNDLHFKLMIKTNEKFLRFHNTSAKQINSCGVEVKEFVYILNNILASEFYYDGFVDAESILKDLSHYRMQFLAQREIESVWNNIIKVNWSMAPHYVAAVDEFYLNKEKYIHRSQGTQVPGGA